MTTDKFIEGIGEVSFSKRRGQKSIKLRVADNKVRVTLPYYTSIGVATKFVLSKQDWILEHIKPQNDYRTGFKVGKYCHLIIEPERSRAFHDGNQIIVGKDRSKIESAIYKSLTEQSKQLIPKQVAEYARQLGVEPTSVSFRRLKGRWGSCDSSRALTFNSLLIQLPWDLIDYVIIHELSHITHMNHSTDFWDLVASRDPNYKAKRKRLRTWQPIIYNTAYAENR